MLPPDLLGCPWQGETPLVTVAFHWRNPATRLFLCSGHLLVSWRWRGWEAGHSSLTNCSMCDHDLGVCGLGVSTLCSCPPISPEPPQFALSPVLLLKSSRWRQDTKYFGNSSTNWQVFMFNSSWLPPFLINLFSYFKVMSVFVSIYLSVFSFSPHATEFLSHWDSQPTSYCSCKFGGTTPSAPWHCSHLEPQDKGSHQCRHLGISDPSAFHSKSVTFLLGSATDFHDLL